MSTRVNSFRHVLLIHLVAAALVAAPRAGLANSCVVIAHRGASGYVPEHTLEAYQRAIELGADFIEPDIMLTRDGVPIARHDSLLDMTTDVSTRPEFADRRRVQTIAGRDYDGWFVEDFTLDELRTLRAIERFPETRVASAQQDGRFGIPTLQEVIELAREADRPVGIYPEIKMPRYFEERGLDIVGAVVDTLSDNGYDSVDSPVIVQSFDRAALERADALTGLRLVYLLWAAEPEDRRALVTPTSLREISKFADGIGVPKYGFVVDLDQDDPDAVPRATALVRDARGAGLFVHAFTFRAENRFLPARFRLPGGDAAVGRAVEELRLFLTLGIDGFFIDHPDIGRKVCDTLVPAGA